MDNHLVAHVKALQGVLYVDNERWTEVKVKALPLPSRKWVEIFNKSPYKAFYSYDNTFNLQGSFAIKAGGLIIVPLSESVPIYVRGIKPTMANAQKIVIAEVA
jgi:hypothetical protein